MKTRNFNIAIASLILVSMTVWFSCEKEEILPINVTTETMELSSEISAYLTGGELNAFYEEFEVAKKQLPPLYNLRKVEIVMENEVKYINPIDFSIQSTKQILHTGYGVWEDFGKIKYSEILDLPVNKVRSSGKGTILLMRPNDGKVPIIESPLNFESSFSKGDKINDSRGDRFQEQRIYSRLDFTDGEDIFDGVYGTANKIEIYSCDRPNFYKGVIYGYVAIKVK